MPLSVSFEEASSRFTRVRVRSEPRTPDIDEVTTGVEALHTSPSTMVIAGYSPSHPTTSWDKNVVVKVAFTHDKMDSLRDEYDAYRKLKDIQGVWIPRCYGLYRCTSRKRHGPKGCLVLQYCGRKCPQPLHLMPLAFKYIAHTRQ